MPKKFSINPKAQEAREKEATKKELVKKSKQEKADEEYWKETDKHVLQKQDRQQQREQQEEEKRRKQEEKKQLYEQEQRSITSNKQCVGITKKQFKEEQMRIFQNKLQQVQLSDDDDEQQQEPQEIIQQVKIFDPEMMYSSDEDFDKSIGQNENHVKRAKLIEDLEKYNEIIDAQGIEEALAQLGDGQQQIRYKEYVRQNLKRTRNEFKGFRHSQIMEILWKQWKCDERNPQYQH